MTDTPTVIRIAQAIGLTASASFAGAAATISFYCIPCFLLSPSPLLTRQWALLYHHGRRTIPVLATLSSLCYGYLAYKLSSPSALPRSLSSLSLEILSYKARLYGTAAVLVVSVVPFTLVFMKGLNEKLLGKAEDYKGFKAGEEVTEVGIMKGESVKEMVDQWGLWNAVRGLFPLAATVLGMLATV